MAPADTVNPVPISRVFWKDVLRPFASVGVYFVFVFVLSILIGLVFIALEEDYQGQVQQAAAEEFEAQNFTAAQIDLINRLGVCGDAVLRPGPSIRQPLSRFRALILSVLLFRFLRWCHAPPVHNRTFNCWEGNGGKRRP